MIKQLHELLEKMASGDLREHRHPNVQLKESWKMDAGKQLCGRANDLKYPCSWMVIGVKDDGSLGGRDEYWAKAQEEQVSSHVNQYLDPSQTCTHLRCHPVRGSWVVVVGSTNAGTVTRWAGEAYMSSGTTCLKMEPEEALELAIQLPGLQDLSAQPWHNGKVDHSSVQVFAERVSKRDGGNALASLHQLSPAMALERLHLNDKVASKILFGDMSCRLVTFDAGDNVLGNQKISPLHDVLTRSFQDSLSERAGRPKGSAPVWPPLALSEGIANAIAHAAYFEKGGEITIEVHPRHLRVSNLCVSSAAAFANKWFSRNHRTLNTLLMETLRLAGYVDELGRGKHLIMREMLLAGMSPPSVIVESAGNVSRWCLTLPSDESDERNLRLLERIQRLYENDEKKALMAFAMCLWHEKPYSEVQNHIGSDHRQLLNTLLSEIESPVFLLEKHDKLIRTRWVRLIVEEGLDSKQFSPGEEQRLYHFAYGMQTEHNAAVITPSELRRLGQMGDTAAEKSLSSRMLKRWEAAGLVVRVGRGKFRFTEVEVGESVGNSLL